MQLNVKYEITQIVDTKKLITLKKGSNQKKRSEIKKININWHEKQLSASRLDCEIIMLIESIIIFGIACYMQKN